MSNTAYVSTGKPKVSGAVFRAPLGSTLPTSASATLDNAFKELGYVSDDGVTNSNAPESSNIKAWGGQVVLVVQTEKKDEWKLKLIESLNPEVLKTVYGDSHVTVDSTNHTITVNANAEQLADHCYVIDTVMKGNAMKRIVIPVGSLSNLADIVYKDDEAVGYEITISALPDSSGNNHYEYIVQAAASSST